MPKAVMALGLLIGTWGCAAAQGSMATIQPPTPGVAGPVVSALETRFLIFRERPHVVACPKVMTLTKGAAEKRLNGVTASVQAETNCETREVLLKHWKQDTMAISIEQAIANGDTAHVELLVSKGLTSWKEVFSLRRSPQWGVVGYSITNITIP